MRILTEEMLKESSFYQMILEEGIEKGMEKATSGLRNAIREVVSSRFPGPVDLAALDQIKDIDRLQQILTVTLRAQNLAEITAQI
jgi:predicted transposase YdaD